MPILYRDFLNLNKDMGLTIWNKFIMINLSLMVVNSLYKKKYNFNSIFQYVLMVEDCKRNELILIKL